jgi:hypothetical protein
VTADEVHHEYLFAHQMDINMVNKQRLDMLHPSVSTEYIAARLATHLAMLNEETSIMTVDLRATYGSVDIP